MGHPVDYCSHVNTVIGLLEDNRPLDESTQVGVREALLASNFLLFHTKAIFKDIIFKLEKWFIKVTKKYFITDYLYLFT